MGVAVHDAGKAVLLAIITLSLMGLVAGGRADWTDVEPLMWGIVGYVAGNGVLAVTRQQPSPMLNYRADDRRE